PYHVRAIVESVTSIERPSQRQEQRKKNRDRKDRDGTPPRPPRPGLSPARERQDAGAKKQHDGQILEDLHQLVFGKAGLIASFPVLNWAPHPQSVLTWNFIEP